ncbi:MAG: hypothetical protein A2046_15845 [Bacteroidetes bacterium GWA2_30_7]|nr:MAG: hypothetical protein A2046_15845 [Bacteroidetes bacterium GWA2_30_7]
MKSLIRSVNNINNDNKSGSISLLNEVIVAAEEFYVRNKDENINLVNNILIDQLYKVYKQHSQLTSIFHFINELFKFLDLSITELKSSEDAICFIKEYKEVWSSIDKLLYNNLVTIFDIHDKKVLLHSNSSTIQMLFDEFKNNNIAVQVFQTVSHPAKEGLIQANYLADNGFDVTLIEDSAIGTIIENVNMIFLGADAVFNDYFINKTGSKAIAITGKYNAVPVFVFADSRKFFNEKNANMDIINKFQKIENHSADEILNSIKTKMKVENSYFEKIPNTLVSRFINEKGVFTGKNIANISNQFSVSKLLI